MIKKIPLLISLIALFLMGGCDHPQTKDTLRGLQGNFNDAREQFDRLSPLADSVGSLTTEQLNKLIVFEYKTISLPTSLSSREIEGILNQAGAERWECFSIVPTANGMTAFCRRLPYALLRSFLRMM